MTRKHEKGARRPKKPEITVSAREHYHREKARRAGEATPHGDLLAEAQKDYEALLVAEAAKRKGGRPKGKTAGLPKTDAESAAEDEAAEE